MIRTLLTSTALAMLLATGAIAQNAGTAGTDDLLAKGYSIVDTDGLASKLIGFPVYSSEANDAEQYGEINDLVIGQNGEVTAVILGVGGFLGVGEKNVAVSYDDLQWVTAQDNTERLVLQTTQEALNAAPAVELTDDEPMNTAAAPAADQPAATGTDANATAATSTAANTSTNANAPAANATDTAAAPAPSAPAANATDTAAAPAANAQADATQTGTVNTNNTAAAPAAGSSMDPFDPARSTAVDVSTLTADDLKGTNVYGPDNQHIGTIGDFVLAEDGKTLDAVIIDFGGFLGIGTKPVAIAYDSLPFFADEAGNRSLVLNLTREQMEAAPAFNRDTYAAERDTQRLVVEGAA